MAFPETREEEEEVVGILHRPDVGVFFALGGSAALGNASRDLGAVLARRQGRKGPVTDPVVANIIRCQGIDAGRRYRRFRNGRYRATEGDPDLAAKLLGRLGRDALMAFDKTTADATANLCKTHAHHAKQAQGKGKTVKRKR